MSDLFEGSIIRAFRRLDELLHEMVFAARTIGNTELENKFSEGSNDLYWRAGIMKTRRDIVFAASLYL